MPVAAALPVISAGLGAAGSIASMFGHGHVGQTAQGPASSAGFRNQFMNWLGGGGTSGNSNYNALTVPGYDSAGNPNGPLQAMKGLFTANINQAQTQAKENAGNLTGSSLNNYLGSATAPILAQENATIGQMGMQGSIANQGTMAGVMNSFGNQGVSAGQPYYQPSSLSGLAGIGGPLGTLAGMFAGNNNGGSVRYGGQITQDDYNKIASGAQPAQGQASGQSMSNNNNPIFY